MLQYFSNVLPLIKICPDLIKNISLFYNHFEIAEDASFEVLYFSPINIQFKAGFYCNMTDKWTLSDQ